MFNHWDKAEIALTDDDPDQCDICIEWHKSKGHFLWLDIERDGAVRTLRGYGEDEIRIEQVWRNSGVDLFVYVNAQLDEIYGKEKSK